MTDPELQAAMQVLSVLSVPRLLYRPPFVLLASVPHGEPQHAARDERRFRARLWLSRGLCSVRLFHRYSDGYRFAKLACDLVEKHGFIASQRKVYASAALVAAWTQPIATAIDFDRTAIRAAIETGDLTYACLSMY